MHQMYEATPEFDSALRRSGMNVRELADAIGYSKSYLYNLRAGRAVCRRVVGERIAALLDVDFYLIFVVSTRKETGE